MAHTRVLKRRLWTSYPKPSVISRRFRPPPVAGRDLDDTARAADSLVVVGTRESNPLLRELAEQRFYEPGDDAEGYTLRIAPSPYQ